VREQPVDLRPKATGGLGDPPPARNADRSGADRPQRARGRRSSTHLGAAVTAVALGGGIENLGGERVNAATLTRSACGQPTVNVLRHPEQKLLRPQMLSLRRSDITWPSRGGITPGPREDVQSLLDHAQRLAGSRPPGGYSVAWYVEADQFGDPSDIVSAPG